MTQYYNFFELAQKNVKEIRSLVRKHNLHTQIKGYGTMKKTELIQALLQKNPPKSGAVAAPPMIAKKPKPPPARRKMQAVGRTPATPKPNPKPKPKRRIAPTLVTSATGTAAPLRTASSKGMATYQKTVDNLTKKAATMDKSKRGQRLLSNSPVKRSKQVKTVNNYRSGKNYM